MKNKKLTIVEKTLQEALLFEVAKAVKEGLVVEVDTTDGEHFAVLIQERKEAHKDHPLISLSAEAVLSARACGCRYVANIFGSCKACAIVAVDAPHIESYDEWDSVIHTYANPLLKYE